jgi:hypothetical protein
MSCTAEESVRRRLTGRAAVITGAGSGIGLAFRGDRRETFRAEAPGVRTGCLSGRVNP